MRFFRNFHLIRYHIATVVVAIAIYIWSAITGHKLTGDDNMSKEGPRSGGPGVIHHK